jgi:thymidylate synthase (FAD)
MEQIKVELQETMGSDQAIANAAWTSTYNKEKREDKYDDPAKVEDIVRRCIRDGHSVPVESVIFRFWIRLPIFADRQHMTHRIASHNGLSGRYRTVPSDFYGVPDDICDIFDKIHPGAGSTLWQDYRVFMEEEYRWYKEKLGLLKLAEDSTLITNAEYKRSREFLRGVLGSSFMVERTTIFNLHSFANYQRLRNSKHAQPEIKRIAELMLGEVVRARVAPIAIDELQKQGWMIAKPNLDEWSVG